MHILLHNHDKKGSLLDSILDVEEIAQFAEKNNCPAIAITNHGTMFSFVDFYKACVKRNVKPILGCEVYEVNNMMLKDKDDKRYHLVLLASNKKGLKNLFKLVTKSYELGFYYKPRVDLNYIKQEKLGEGIICLTGCQAGRLSKGLSEGLDMTQYWHQLKSIFDYTVVELQSHATESQNIANQLLLNFALRNNTPYTITTDSHMASKDQQETHSIFVEIGEGREVGESYEGCYLQTEEEIHMYMDDILSKDVVNKAIQESINIADMIEVVDIGLKQPNQMPEIEIPKNYNSQKEYFMFLIEQGYKNKGLDKLDKEIQDIYKNRIEEEIPVLKALNYIDYFIMLYMLANEADKRKIPRGYSRGSGANCLCLYLLGVTQIDSIKWDLDFSRFANLGRKSVADFDWDISKLRRKEMVTISEELFGKDRVVPICTFNTLSTKVAIRDIGKVLDERKIYDIPYKLRDEVAKMIPTIKTLNDLGEEEEKDVLLKEILFKNEKLKQYYEQYPKWFQYVMELEGSPKSLGRHAAGTLITPKPIVEYCPMCLDSDGNMMLQLEMHNAMDDLSLVKMDYLGLKTLDVIDKTLELAGLSWQDVDINHLNLEDKKVYEEIYKKGNCIGIFQMESAEAIRMCIEAQTDNIEDVIAINAFNRPGTKEGFPTYIENKKDKSKAVVIHEDLKNIFNKTYYVLLYQEQALQVFRYAGFPEDRVDNARRAIGKKIKEVMESLYSELKQGLYDNGWSESQIEDIWKLLLKQAEYSFNRGHSVAYALLSFLTAYLKSYYPLEFMTACLINDTGNISKLSILINECHRLGIKVLPPSINESKEYFTARKNKNDILFGILPIKGIGDIVAKTIIDNQPYKTITEFLNKTNLSKDVVIALIKAGAFSVNNKRTLLLKYAESLTPLKEYEPVVTLPTLKELKEKWDVEGNNKEERLQLYNEKRRIIFKKEQNEKQQREIQEFVDKYMQDEYMWEFETLSMFLSNNPFEKAYRYIKPFDEIDDGVKAVVICTVVDIKRKKDKNGNSFAYLDLYTPFGIIEAICWSSKYAQFQEFIKKGNSLAILGRKGEEKLFVESIKGFEQWKIDKGFI
jgi:DNA polymerase-3 subunit alpha